MDNPNNRNSESQFAHTKSVKSRLAGASGNNNFLASESRKALILQGFPGFLFFTGYNLATRKGFFVAIQLLDMNSSSCLATSAWALG
jgi:hypothetical protein